MIMVGVPIHKTAFAVLALAAVATDAASEEPSPTSLETDQVAIVGFYETPLKKRWKSSRVFIGLLNNGEYIERIHPPCTHRGRRGRAMTCLSKLDRRGTWTLTHRGKSRLIQFDRGPRLEYAIDADGLRLRKVRGRKWESLVRSESSWCFEPSDCGRYNMAHPACVGGFSCESNKCRFACRSSPPLDLK